MALGNPEGNVTEVGRNSSGGKKREFFLPIPTPLGGNHDNKPRSGISGGMCRRRFWYRKSGPLQLLSHLQSGEIDRFSCGLAVSLNAFVGLWHYFFLLFKHAILFASIHPRIGRVRLTEFRTVHLLISALPGNPQVGAPLFSCDRRAYHNYWISATASS
jgi:hypothetical protein